MTNKAKRSNKNKSAMYGLCAAIVVVVVVIVVAIFAMKEKPLDESFFVSDNTKYVAVANNDMSASDIEYPPIRMYIAYFYSGDKVTGLKMYYEYEDEDTAKKSAETLKETGEDELKDAKTNGKYVVITAPKRVYEDMTAEDAKQQVEFLEKFQNLNSGDDTNEE